MSLSNGVSLRSVRTVATVARRQAKTAEERILRKEVVREIYLAKCDGSVVYELTLA